MADQDEIRGNSVYQVEEPVTETPSPVEKPVAVKEQKSGLMAKLVSPYPILTPSSMFFINNAEQDKILTPSQDWENVQPRYPGGNSRIQRY